MNFLKAITLLLTFFFISGISYGQKSMGADIPDYMLAEGANPMIYIYSMETMKSSSEFGSIQKPQRDKSLSEFPSMDDAVFDKLSEAIEAELTGLGIQAAGFINLGAATSANPDEINRLNEKMIESGSYYTMTFTIMEWSKVAKAIEKADGLCTLDMVKNPAFSISVIGDTDYSRIYTVMGGKDLQAAMAFLKKEIEGQKEGYFQTAITNQDDVESMLQKSQAISDIWLKESKVMNTWPSDSELSAGKTLVVCQGIGKKNRFMNYAEDALKKHYSFDFDIVSISELQKTDLSAYNYVLVPKKKMVEKSKVVGQNGMAARPGDQNTRLKTYTEAAYHYRMKKVSDYTVYEGSDAKAISEYSMGNLPLALKRFLKVYGK